MHSTNAVARYAATCSYMCFSEVEAEFKTNCEILSFAPLDPLGDVRKPVMFCSWLLFGETRQTSLPYICFSPINRIGLSDHAMRWFPFQDRAQ